MAHGLKVQGANNQIIFDSNESNVEFFAVGDEGTLNPTGTTSVTFNRTSEMLFLRPSSGYSLVKGNTTQNANGTTTFTINSGTSANNGNRLNYFKCIRTSTATANSDTYGLEVYDYDANNQQKTIFSSRRMSSTVDIVKVWDDKQLGGSTAQFTNSRAEAYSGTVPNNMYVSTQLMFSSSIGGQFDWGSFEFNPSKINFVSFINLGFFGSFNLPNFGNVVIGTLRG